MADNAGTVPGFIVEGVDLAAVGVQLDPLVVPETLAWCVRQLNQITPNPEAVELVVTNNFTASIRHRMSHETQDTSHADVPGSGLSVGKTLRLPDGTSVVFLHAYCFRTDLAAEEQEAIDHLVRRTLVHEAQHVAMHQNGQTYRGQPPVGLRDVTLIGAAEAIVEEYRAERSVGVEFRQGEPTWELEDIVTDLSNNLDAAVAAYQNHRDVDGLVFEISTAVLLAWRGFAYVAARQAVLKHTVPLPRSLATDPTWHLAFAAAWDDLVELLQRAEPGTVVMADETLVKTVEGLAEMIGHSIADLGFLWDHEYFLISPEYFQTASWSSVATTTQRHHSTVLQRFRSRPRRTPLNGGRLA